jgi:hypothetical protein
MSDWGRKTFGDPCRECDYDWSISQEDAISLVGEMPSVFRKLVEGQDVSRRHPDLSWSVKQYVCHVVDNLRISAERLAGAAAGGDRRVGAYDQDSLAEARNYEQVLIEGALWSLERAVRDWQDAIELSSKAGVVLSHPERGDQSVLDVCRNNAHDANHHRWDIERSLE